MAVQSERLPKRPSFVSQRRNSRARALHLASAFAVKEGISSGRKYRGMLAGLLSIPLGVLLLILCLSLWLLSGYVLGRLSPEYMVTVRPFEVIPEAGDTVSISSKGASDLVVDIVNDAAMHAAQFHGTDYYRYAGGGARPVSLRQSVKIPVQSSNGVEPKMVSRDGLLHLYDRARYDPWIISGDVVSTPAGLVGRIRLKTAHTAKSWETAPSPNAAPSELVRQAAYQMLEKEVPELLGQSYLQQAQYDAAEKVFRQWEIDDPQNWKPTYYLSLLNSYQDKGHEAGSLATLAPKRSGQ